jgi:hypothetical protein
MKFYVHTLIIIIIIIISWRLGARFTLLEVLKPKLV